MPKKETYSSIINSAYPENQIKLDLQTTINEMQGLDESVNHFFPGLFDYWQDRVNSSKSGSLPHIYHGTLCSNLTGIIHNGLVMHGEELPQYNGVYGTISPFSAACHILQKSSFDTHDNNPLKIPDSFDDQTPNLSELINFHQNNPPVLLEIDVDSFIKVGDYAPATEKNMSIDNLILVIQNKYRHLNLIDYIGINLGRSVPSKYIKVLIHTNNSDPIQVLSLQEWYQRLLA